MRDQTGCLACMPAPSIRDTNTPHSLVTDPLCYINLTFFNVTSTYSELLLGWHFVSRLNVVMSKRKINRWRHDLSNGTTHAWLVLIKTFETTHRKCIKSSRFGSSCSDGLRGKRATNILQKSCLFSSFFTFLQKCKRTGRNLEI